jgi:cellulose synthase/poly-beta-1,6-N-acetylglucosamine synthase-like glycosyltransferase
MSSAADLIALMLAAFTTVYAFYNLGIGLRGILPDSKPPAARAHRRFAILIPAHNEASVLGPLLQSLEAQHYPRDRFEIFVSADHCSDNTAEIARRHGAIVLERHHQARRGKTWNVRWALAHIPVAEFNAVAIIDADNLAHPEYLAAINDYLEAHPHTAAVQAYLDVKNPDDSWVTKSIAISYWFSNRFNQGARAQLGLCCMLGGTGMVLRTEAVAQVTRLESLVDDLELTALLALRGQAVGWCARAIIFDEKPVTLTASLQQRQRWMQGHFWVLAQFGPRALRSFLGSGRLLHLDLLLTLAWPAITLLGLIASVIQVGSWLWTDPFGGALWSWAAIIAVVAAAQALIGPSVRLRRLTWRYVLAVPGYVLFGFSWLIVLVLGLVKAHDQGHWAKTEHTRALGHPDLEASLESSRES